MIFIPRNGRLFSTANSIVNSRDGWASFSAWRKDCVVDVVYKSEGVINISLVQRRDFVSLIEIFFDVTQETIGHERSKGTNSCGHQIQESAAEYYAL